MSHQKPNIQKPNIIVEICQNHGGSAETMREMVRQAAEHGADIVKMQSIWSDDLTKRERFEEGIVDDDGTQQAIKRPYDAEYERLKKLDVTLEDHEAFIAACDEHGVIPMTTIFARHRIPQVAQLPWTGRWIKIASYDSASYPMLRELADHFDNFIISTGASHDQEIEATASLMKDLGKRVVFLHCVTSYPNTRAMCNLARMEWHRQFSPEVGWSDHTKVVDDGILAAKSALALGADYIERHFTILASDATKDGPVSITPALLSELAEFRDKSLDEQVAELDATVPMWREMVGEPTRAMTHTELLNRDYYRGRFAGRRDDGSYQYNWDD
jgi:N,N'-diacetyllegionaminate synthase